MKRAFAFVLVFFLTFLSSAFARAEENFLLVLVSQRNAETIAEAARLFQQRYPNLSIQARTDVQLRALNPEQRQQLFKRSRALLGIGLYGPLVSELETLLNQYPKSRLLISSDHRLLQLNHINNRQVFPNSERIRELAKINHDGDFDAWLNDLLNKYPQQSDWITARSYWQAGGSDNAAALFAWLFQQLSTEGKETKEEGTEGKDSEGKDAEISVSPAKPLARLRWQLNGQIADTMPALQANKSVIAVIDHPGGDRPADSVMIRDFCTALTKRSGSQCLTALAYWGEAGVQAVEHLQSIGENLSAIVMLQDFVIGGGEGREAVNQIYKQLNVPILKAIKLRDRSEAEWKLSSDGLAHEKVYYQVAMPELQGASQPLVIAAAGKAREDELTGIRIQPIEPVTAGIDSIVQRVTAWQALQRKANADKRIAIIYYNHPPGRHNIGADNLDVPASLWQILNQLKDAGYRTGELPASQEALLTLMQQRGVNLPRDKAALEAMSRKVPLLSPDAYRAQFKTLPKSVQHEMVYGPFGLLHEQVQAAIKAEQPLLGQHAVEHIMEEMHHLLEGVDHKGRERALHLLEQLEHCYFGALKTGDQACMGDALKVIAALQKIGIEGLAGWGEAPGKVMTVDGQILLPGLQFGNVFIGPQPPRGWEINEELLHANLAFPPPHQYLAFYQYLREDFKADALVHLGRHSTYEFLPRRSVGLAEDDYSRLIAGDIPGVYPYIVDGVGEGIQAKRRGLAVMVDHLTPPLQSTPLYDDLLQLRQLVESFEAMHGSENKAVTQRLVRQIREKIEALELTDELAEAMSAELAVMGISFSEVDDDLLVHEVGHYLTDLQERFMPFGLHIYGKDWKEQAVTMMLNSMAPESAEQAQEWRAKLVNSPKAEMDALLRGLSGGYIEPGQGNDPIRSPTSLPTGRNFFALDSSLIPSPVAWQLGKEMAAAARANNKQSNKQSADKREAMVLWASDVVRDEGVMIAFGLDMLGIEPVWNSRGLVKGLKRQALKAPRVRRDMVFTTSGLFRDLYGQQMRLLNRATLLALDASSDTIVNDYPALTLALQEALSALGEGAQGGDEPLQQNQVAAHWVKQARQLLVDGVNAKQAGVIASYRVFGDAPGSYGAGINRLAERSGAWEHRSELAAVYMRRLGHSYGIKGFGVPSQQAFKTVLQDVENTYFGRSSNLYGLIDNNDAFDYLGGLSLSVETVSGSVPNNFVLDHSDPNAVKAMPLGRALRQELRGRFLNPEWLKGLMEHDYAGARTMGSEFLEYLWGWQITNPTLVGDWAWEEVKAVYIDDRYQLQLDEFLQQGHNAHVKANMLAIMLVAVHKQFWQADQQTIQQLAKEFADLVVANGLPGSGHTDPEQPMLPWLEQHLSAEDWRALAAVVNKAKPDAEQVVEQHRITELNVDRQDPVQQLESQQQSSPQQDSNASDSEGTEDHRQWQWLALIALLGIIAMGFYRGLRQART